MLLEDLVGQDAALAVIRRAASAQRVPHAYLFEGPRGVGKHAAAIGLALLLNCEETDRTNDAKAKVACGGCESCRRILGRLHPDVITVGAVGAQIVMEQAQEIVAMVQTQPHEARARVIIVDDADRMNANAANCLLKTLEEPASRTHLVLLTDAPEKLLGTVRSRTQRVRFRSVSQAWLMTLAARRGANMHEAQVASVMADGRVGRFLQLLSPLADPKRDSGSAPAAAGQAGQLRDVVVALRQAATSGSVVDIFDTAAALGDKETKSTLPDALAVLGRVYRDAIATRAGAPELALFTRDTAADVNLPLGLPVAGLSRALDVIVEADSALAGNVNAVMALERLLIHLNRVERESGHANP